MMGDTYYTLLGITPCDRIVVIENLFSEPGTRRVPRGVQMPQPTNSDDIEWFRYSFVAIHDLAKTWLTTEKLLGLASNTLDAYARGLDDFLGFCQRTDISPVTATRADLARYVGDLR